MSDAPKGKAENKFKPIPTLKNAYELIKEGVTHQSSTVIWSQNKAQVLNTYLFFFSESEKALYAWVPEGFAMESFATELARMSRPECFFTMALPSTALFFKCEYLGMDRGGLKFRLPEKVFEVQRRENFRLGLPKIMQVNLKFTHPALGETKVCRLLDISTGGAGFLIDMGEEHYYPKDMVIEDIDLTIRRRKVVFTGQVRYTSLYPLYAQERDGMKVGLKFEKIDPADVRFINLLIFEEGRKMFSKLMGK